MFFFSYLRGGPHRKKLAVRGLDNPALNYRGSTLWHPHSISSLYLLGEKTLRKTSQSELSNGYSHR